MRVYFLLKILPICKSRLPVRSRERYLSLKPSKCVDHGRFASASQNHVAIFCSPVYESSIFRTVCHMVTVKTHRSWANLTVKLEDYRWHHRRFRQLRVVIVPYPARQFNSYSRFTRCRVAEGTVNIRCAHVSSHPPQILRYRHYIYRLLLYHTRTCMNQNHVSHTR